MAMTVPTRHAHRDAIALGLLFAHAACAAPAEFINRPKQALAWPSPAADPRIDLEFAYGGSADVVRHPGVFGWLAALVAGEESQRLVSPSGLTTAGDVLWIADPGAACVHRVSLSTGEHQRITGNGTERLVTPIGVAALPNGRVFVTDAGSAQVVVLDHDGTIVRRIGAAGDLLRPTGVCFDEHRTRVLVVDTVGCRLLVFDPEGNRIGAVGERGTGPGQFNYPTNVAMASDGRVLVVDSLNFRVQVLSPDLEPLHAFGQVGRGPGDFASPKGIALDSQDHVYVVDSMFDNVQIFDLSGRLLLAVGSSGTDLGQLYLPTGIHADGLDRIYVSDAGNSRIQVMQFRSGK